LCGNEDVVVRAKVKEEEEKVSEKMESERLEFQKSKREEMSLQKAEKFIEKTLKKWKGVDEFFRDSCTTILNSEMACLKRCEELIKK